MPRFDIDHITRIEGHGNLKVVADKGKVKAKFEVYESPRFFEAILKGKRYDEVPIITPRICGICASSHALAAIKGVEAAMGVRPTPQTVLLRKILLAGETIQSHVLHVYFLALPDFLGASSVIPVAEKDPHAVKRALMFKKLGNEICRVVGGRSVHPISATVGGFTKVPTEKELADLREQLTGARIGAERTVEIFETIEMPEFIQEREYAALTSTKEFALYDGKVKNLDGWVGKPSEYMKRISEKVVGHSTAKHSSIDKKPFMVGALARVNINRKKLSKNAQRAMEVLGFSDNIEHNTFFNNLAQVVELVHLIDDTIEKIDMVLDKGLKQEKVRVRTRKGSGVGIVEAPRGTLCHEYSTNSKGRITKANVVTPTAQNLNRIERDVEAFVPTVLKRPKKEIILEIEELIRSYDPCISCSTHLIGI